MVYLVKSFRFYLVSGGPSLRVRLVLPFEHEPKLQCVDMVHFLYLDDVNDRHGHVDVNRDVQVVHFIKTERGYFLVVIVLGK